MSNDLPYLFWSSKQETGCTYNGVAAALIWSGYNAVLRSSLGAKDMIFPKLKHMLATHNNISVQKAMEIDKERGSQATDTI